MRKLKKFKRYDEGGAVGSGSGDPFSYTDFSDRARNLKKPEAAPIGERDTSRKAPKPAEETRTEKATESAETKPVETGRGKITSTPTMTDEESRADSDKGAAPSSFTTTGNAKKAEEYRQSLMSGNKPAASRPAVEKTPTAPAKPSYVGAGDSDDSVDTKRKNELERLKRVGSGAVEQTMMGPVETIALGASKLPAMARAGFGAARKAYDEFTKPATKPTPKTEPTLTPSTPAPSTPASSTTPRGGDPRAAANRRAAESETKEAPKETPIRVDPRAAANRRAAEAKEAPKEAPTRVDPRAAANRRAAESEGKQAPKEAPKAKSTADDEVAQEAAKRAAASRPRVTPKRQEDSAKFGGGKGTPSKAKTKAEVKPTAKKFDKPVGEKEGPTVDKVLEREGLSAKKGGKIPAFKSGGLVSRADGCAIRGKTKGRMV
jgi:hypothetical protein